MKNKPLTKIFFWGGIISFLGSLPLGPLNIFTTYVSESKGVSAGFAFAAGCIIVEIIYVRITLVAINWLQSRKKLFKMLEWISVVIIFALAVFCFYAAYNNLSFIASIPAIKKYPFLAGMFFSLIEPMKIPFWFVWTTFLMTNKTLIPVNKYYNYFVAGVATGSFFGFMPFIFSGNYFIVAIKTHQVKINLITGIILLLTALIQVYRTLKKKVADIQPKNVTAKS